MAASQRGRHLFIDNNHISPDTVIVNYCKSLVIAGQSDQLVTEFAGATIDQDCELIQKCC